MTMNPWIQQRILPMIPPIYSGSTIYEYVDSKMNEKFDKFYERDDDNNHNNNYDQWTQSLWKV